MSSDLLAAAAEVVDAWAPLAAHPNLGCPRGAFASGELGGGVALFLAHAFQPCALTLEQVHLLPTSGPSGALVSIFKFCFYGGGPGLACTTLWSIACLPLLIVAACQKHGQTAALLARYTQLKKEP